MSEPGHTIKHMIESPGPAIGIDSTSGCGAAAGSGEQGLPLERLEAEICQLAGHPAAATCRFLVLVGDFDARRGWASWELPSCAAWLAWKCQVAPALQALRAACGDMEHRSMRPPGARIAGLAAAGASE